MTCGRCSSSQMRVHSICITTMGVLEFGRHTAYTVDLVIFACFNFREFQILELVTKFKIREFSFFFSSAIIIIIFARFLNSRICSPREIRENKNHVYSIYIRLQEIFKIKKITKITTNKSASQGRIYRICHVVKRQVRSFDT